MKEIPIIAAIWYPDENTPVHNVTNLEHGVTLCGYRHSHVMGQFTSLTNKRTAIENHIQGFLTNLNRFVDRKEAHKLWVDAGFKPDFNDELYSEDLYGEDYFKLLEI